MKRQLYIMAILLLPLTTPAATDTVQVNTSCCEGNAFTIRIPVRIPAGASGEYEWYRNDTATGVWTPPLAAGVAVAAYTLPAEQAYMPMVLHFKYRLHDDCDDCGEWTASKKYVLTFKPLPAQPSNIAGSATVCADISGLAYSVADVAGVAYEWAVPEGWTITAGQGSSSITVTTEASAGSGNVSVTPSNSCGNGATSLLAVTINSTSMIAGSTVVCAGEPGLTYSVTDVAGVAYEWTVPDGWTITAGQDSSSITVTAGADGGDISVASSGGCTGTLGVSINTECICATVISGGASVATCNGVSVVGNASVATCDDISEVGNISVATCSGGVNVVGSASVTTCSGGVNVVGNINVTTCSGGVNVVGAISVATAP